jgi:ATP/maltotriose-dependent transcriptional regulator MalT/two-component SAPR family response regulator
MSADRATTRPSVLRTRVDLVSDTPPLVMTKIQVPRRRPDLLSRRRLVDFVHAHLDRKLILISAPAGYGKTALLTDFAHDTELPVCWYTLDPFDWDLRVFLEHMVAAIALRFPAFGERSRTFLRGLTDPSGALHPLAATLAQEIYDTIPEYFVLVLDDHHTVEDQERINEFLDLLITYVDENCHFVIASRTLPALPNLSLLLARGQAAGLSIDELRFAPQEVKALARQNYDLELTSEEAVELAEHTGGWITGLLLTAASHWKQTGDKVAARGLANIGLYDYLSKQVLDQQPAALRDFLLASSVLDELNPELCTAVLEIGRPDELMDQLRARNLFVTDFEGGGNRLRYHDLFREFLQANLRRQDDARYRRLTRRAAQVYAARGEWERAISRYLTLQDYDQVAEIVEQTATRMYEAGRWDTLSNWVDALPDASLEARPHLLIHRGKIHTEQGKHALALTLYARAERAFISMGDQAGAALALAREGYVLRAQGHYAEAMARCQTALGLISQDSEQHKLTLALTLRNKGLCHLGLGQSAQGLATLQQALRLYDALDDPYNAGMVHHDLGVGYELLGDLERAARHYQAALHNWRQIGNPGPWANTLNSLGVIHYLRGEYDQALRLLNQALAKVQEAGNLRVEAAIWASLGDVYRDLGAYEQAREAYADGVLIATRADEGFVITYILDGLGNIFRLQKSLTQAHNRLMEALGHAEQHNSTFEIGLCHTSLGILANEEGDVAAARRHLDQAIELLQAGGFKRELARVRLHRAQAAFQAGDQDTAMADLKQAMALADQLGFDQFLVVEGQHLQPMLRYAAQRPDGAAFSSLLNRIEAHQSMLAKRISPIARAETKPNIKIYTLGQPRIELDGTIVQWATTDSKELFFCLLQHPQGLRKEEIGAIFWPGHTPQKLDGIFRSTLYRLRRVLSRNSVAFDAGRYHISREIDYWLDAQDFEKSLDQAASARSTVEEQITLLEQALALHKGDYLEGIYADWCVTERERLRARYMAAMEALAGLYADRGELPRAIELYQYMLSQDQYQELAHRELMRCYYRQNDRAAAIRQYQICVRILRDELGIDPMAETESLYLQIIS